MRMLALAGVALCTLGAAMVAALHIVPAGVDINPVRRTLSEYALHDSAWLFNLGVLALVAGSAAVAVAAMRGGMLPARSVAGIGLILWTAGLAGAVTFPKHNWTIGPSAWGDVHRVASLVAFFSLPIAALALAYAARSKGEPAPSARRIAVLGSVTALAFLGVIAGAVLLEPFTGVRWWQAIPLGTVERALATAEVVVIVALGSWVAKSLQTRRASLKA